MSNELFDALVCEVIKEDKMLFIDAHKPIWQAIPDDVRESIHRLYAQKCALVSSP